MKDPKPIDGATEKDRPWEAPGTSAPGTRHADDDTAEGTREAVNDQPGAEASEDVGRPGRPGFRG